MINIDISALVLIDDDKETIELIEERLKELSMINYRKFYDIEKFLSEFDNSLHIVVIDHYLGAINGLEATRIIKKKNKGNFIIGLSAIEDPRVLKSYINSDIDRFVDKADRDHVEQLIRYIKEGIKEIEERLEYINWFKEKGEKYQYDKGTS